MRRILLALALVIAMLPVRANAETQTSYTLPEVAGPLQATGHTCSGPLTVRGGHAQAFLSDHTIIHETVNGGAVTTVVVTATHAPSRPAPVTLGVGRLIGVEQLPWVVLALQPVTGPVEDHFLISRVQRVNVRNGKTGSPLEFHPDYEANRKLWQAGAMPAGRWDTLEGTRLCGDFVFVAIGDKIYRYAYADPELQHPLLVSPTGLLVMALNAATIIVERNDGRKWLLSIAPKQITRQPFGPRRQSKFR